MGTGPLPLSREVDEFRMQFEEISSEADALVGPLSDEQFAWAPQAAVWSVGDCLDHLNATARTYLPSLDEGIEDAIRRGLYASGPFTYTWTGRLLVRAVAPPVRVRVKAAARLVPSERRARAAITAAFRAYQVQFIDRLRQASGLDLARARVRAPTPSWLRIPLGSGFALMIAHERRHLWQARRLIDDSRFPR